MYDLVCSSSQCKVYKPKAGSLRFSRVKFVLDYPRHPSFEWLVRTSHYNLHLKRFFGETHSNTSFAKKYKSGLKEDP